MVSLGNNIPPSSDYISGPIGKGILQRFYDPENNKSYFKMSPLLRKYTYCRHLIDITSLWR